MHRSAFFIGHFLLFFTFGLLGFDIRLIFHYYGAVLLRYSGLSDGFLLGGYFAELHSQSYCLFHIDYLNFRMAAA